MNEFDKEIPKDSENLEKWHSLWWEYVGRHITEMEYHSFSKLAFKAGYRTRKSLEAKKNDLGSKNITGSL